MKKKNNNIRELVNHPFTQAGPMAGLNLVDMYLLSNERALVLSALQQRFPHATSDLTSTKDWQEKFSDAGFVQAYQSAFVGERAEYQAIEFLLENGIQAEQFASRINQHNDLLTNEGVSYSVKSYSPNNIHALEKVINDSAAGHHIVNKEAYEILEASGKIDQYQDQGIEILNGGYSHAENIELVQDQIRRTFHPISPEFDGLLDDIPIVGAVIAGLSIRNAYTGYKNGTYSKNEALSEVVTDAGKFAGSGIGAIIGAAIGAFIGNAIFPLVGALIGGFFGVLGGAVLLRYFLGRANYKIKWPKSNKAYKYFRIKCNRGFDSEACSKVQESFLRKKDFLNELDDAKNMLSDLSAEKKWYQFLRDDSRIILLQEVIKTIENALKEMESKAASLADILMDYAIKIAVSHHANDKRESYRSAELIYGAIIAHNAQLLMDINQREQRILDELDHEVSDSPNNPHRKYVLSKEQIGSLLEECTRKSPIAKVRFRHRFNTIFSVKNIDEASKKRKDKTIAVGAGAGAGLASAAGTAGIVSILGTASTGTAISGLSGAAATNAVLAVLGGGAIAAGGGGMAMGSVVLVGLAAVPAAVVGVIVYLKRRRSRKFLGKV